MEITGRNGATLENLWLKVVDSDSRHFIFINGRGELECAKEGTQKQAYLEATGCMIVGVYDNTIGRKEFLDDVNCAMDEFRLAERGY